ncbi:spermatogenesis associated 6-like protein isoform 2 [Mus musculus]|uniref:Spermatogenesis associated 6-like protein n=4 Tax=Mus musculus TaxID=10090 RepID=SPA6L_MOUSE|nr:spermatogenesis associated 6-like protein isoform 2 [Mus musculus]NP_941053.2 spermatogenesis associated 6-like protein isoform 2 [Mus musculus]B2RV46.1 RecName: Full=Spermatogenesis associated 6-like protein [Mus musculus]AAI47045.1 RIKEN cDNA 4430402I18 gene [Mus musculus]AAI47046.1 RIKEN cDNA 4430402I18 gene [Mus musculus]|eukprot:NP_941053.2 spermatogenesis associated 6-like protein [Mus musculus]
MRFVKVFEEAIDPGAVAELLESFLTRFELVQLVSPAWEELAYYEKNTRDFLFPEPRLASSHLGMQREVLMKTAIWFPGIAPKIEFSTRTAILECVFPCKNRFICEERCRLERSVSKSHGQRVQATNRKKKPKEKDSDQLPKGTQSRLPSPQRLHLHRPTQRNHGKSFKFPGERKPPFVVRHVDSGNPFGENNLEHCSKKSRRKPKLINFDLSKKRASSLDSLEANIKVIREPDERIVLKSQPPPPVDSSESRKPSLSHQGDASLHTETSVTTSQLSRPPSPLNQPLLQERFQPFSQSTWQKIPEGVRSLLTSHRAHPKDSFISETNSIHERPSYPLKKHLLRAQRYF